VSGGRGSVWAAAGGCALVLAAPGTGDAGAGQAGFRGEGALLGGATAPHGELRKTVPIAERRGAEPRTVLSLPLPRVRAGDRLRFNGEVTVTTTCVDRLERCIGRRYGFDPRLRAWVVMAQGAGTTGGARARRISGGVGLACEQTRPNRNHHCPLVLSDRFRVGEVDGLPCRPGRCRLNMVLSAHHPNRRGGEVVVVGADRPDGSIEGGKGRLNAAVLRAGSGVEAVHLESDRRRVRRLPASFEGGQRVVYSRRIAKPAAGDILLVRARERVRIRALPYFVGSKVVVTGRRNAIRPGARTRRILSRRGTATETNGFNCTPGPSAFRSPCTVSKAGLVVVERTPRDRRGRRVPLFVNVVSRTFPKRAQAVRGSFPPARILPGGGLDVALLRPP